MGKILNFLCVIFLVFSLSITVFATEAPSLSANCTLEGDGSCQVSLSLTLKLTGEDGLLFPLPQGATGVQVNGERVSTSRGEGVENINLSRLTKGINGPMTINIQYELHGLVTQTDFGTLELKVPLLSGFAYPIDSLQFSVMLPGQTEAQPSFSSGYHQASIEQHLTYTKEGATISGSSLKQMKDHETLEMTLPVDETLFPRAIMPETRATTAWVGVGICAGLALLYWLLTLRAFPRRSRCTEVPQGVTAGQVGSIVGSSGMDLTLTVFTWAQLGYILIQPKGEKILLHKRMDMGNERGEHEQRIFRDLFGSRGMIDATGSRYADLASRLSGRAPGLGEMLHPRSGNPFIFRVFVAGIGAFAGGGLGAVLGGGAALQGFLTFLLGAAGAVSSWYMAAWTDSGLFRKKLPVFLSWLLAIFWIVLGFLAKKAGLGFVMGLGMPAAGVLYGWAGLRTEQGSRTAGELLGLKRYLQGGNKSLLQRVKDLDPDYYFRLAPFAIALGVGKRFAQQIGNRSLEACPYLHIGETKKRSAPEWNLYLTQLYTRMNARLQGRVWEKLAGFLHSLKR